MKHPETRTSERFEQRWGVGLITTIGICSGIRESWLQVVALLASILTVIMLARQRNDTSNSKERQVLERCAMAWVIYFLLHAVRLDSAAGLPRLDGPSRALLFAPLLFLPIWADLDWPRLRKILVLAGVVLGLTTWIRAGLGDASGRNFGFFTYSNLLGYAAMTIFGVLATTLRGARGLVGQGLALAGCLVAAVASGTRGALIALPLVALVLAYQHRHIVYQRLKPVAAVAAVVIFMAAIALPNVQTRFEQARQDLASVVEQKDYNGSIGQRLAMWQVSAAMIQDQPWLGQGLDVFPDQMQPWADRLGLNVQFTFGGYQNPHNLYLGWAASLGIPTALILLALIGCVPWWAASRLMRNPSEDARQAYTALRVLLVLLGVYCLTESVIERQRGMAWFIVWISLILGSLAVSARKARLHGSTRQVTP